MKLFSANTNSEYSLIRSCMLITDTICDYSLIQIQRVFGWKMLEESGRLAVLNGLVSVQEGNAHRVTELEKDTAQYIL